MAKTHERWPGVVLFAKSETTTHVFEWFDEAKHERHQKYQSLGPKQEYLRRTKFTVASVQNEEALLTVPRTV